MRTQQQILPNPGGEDIEVCSETLQIESKIFFCDAKSNTRGLYLKVSEKKANRERSTIIVPGQSLPWFRELFNYYATTDASLATSKEYPVESKVFHWSLGCNPWGRYLRISENGAGPKGRSHIMVPCGGANSEGWLAFRDALSRIEAYTSQAAPAQIDVEHRLSAAHMGSPMQDINLLGSYLEGLSMGCPGPSEQAQPPPPPPPQQLPLQQQLHVGQETIVGPGPAPPLLTTTDAGSLLVRAGHKRYFFDACSSPHGEFVRITEVFGQERAAMLVPSDALDAFHQAIGMCMRDYMPGTLPCTLPLGPSESLPGLPTGGPSGGSYLSGLPGGGSGSLPGGGSRLPTMSRGGSGNLPGGGSGLPTMSRGGSDSLPFLSAQQQEWQGLQSSAPTNLLDHMSSRHLSSQHLSSQQQWEPHRL